MNLNEIYDKLPKDLINYRDYLKLFKDIKEKDLEDKKKELIIRNRVYKLIINSKYRVDFINYLIDNTKINDLSNINGFFGTVDNTIDYENNPITIDDIIKLLNDNSKFYEITKNIYNLNRHKINKYGLSKFTNNTFLNLTLKSYLLINDIEYDDIVNNNEGKLDYLDDALEQYINEINKYPRLSKEEEKDLLIKAQNGDVEARNRFVECNLKLVVYIIRKKFTNRNFPLTDLVNEGSMGLIKAIEKYNPDLGVKFSGYASYWIERYINQAIYSQNRNIILPNHLINKIYNYNKHFKVLEEQLKRKPTNDELMKATGYTRDTINLITQYLHDTISENELLKTSSSDEDSNQTLLDCIEDNKSNLEEEIFKKNEYDILNYVLNSTKLSDKEREVLKRRYGYYGKPEKLEEIGKIYNLTRERIRQIENKALLKLKKELIKTKYNGINNYKIKPLYSFFPNIEHYQIDYIIKHLSKEHQILLYKAYHDNFDIISEEILTKEEINTIFNIIIPKINKLLTIVFKDEVEELNKDTIRNLMLIINIYDIRSNFYLISKDSLSTGLLKDGYIDNKNYNIKTIAKLLNKDIFETYEDYLNFVDFIKDKEELSNSTKNRIKRFIK